MPAAQQVPRQPLRGRDVLGPDGGDSLQAGAGEQHERDPVAMQRGNDVVRDRAAHDRQAVDAPGKVEDQIRRALAAVGAVKLMRPTDRVLETGEPLSAYKWLVSANAYLGVDALLPALATGADIIITGRVADPSLFLAPAAYEYGWQPDDLERMARGTVMGHLLECAGQITGGYCADPGRKDIPDFAHIGFPYADVDRDGNCIIGKPADTGGAINLITAKEQLLYEVTDPRAYVTPDITADFTTVQLRQAGANRVAVSGATGKPRSPTLKVSIGYHAGYVGEGEISPRFSYRGLHSFVDSVQYQPCAINRSSESSAWPTTTLKSKNACGRLPMSFGPTRS